MPAKRLPRLQVEVYFLNGKGRSWLLNPATDKLVEDKVGKRIIITHGDAEIVIYREFVAYYAKVKKIVEVGVDGQEDNLLKRIAQEELPELDLI